MSLLDHRLLLTSLLSTAVLISSGCASQSAAPVEIKPLPLLTEPTPAYAQVAWIEHDQHAVIGHIDGYRHSLSNEPHPEAPCTSAMHTKQDCEGGYLDKIGLD